MSFYFSNIAYDGATVWFDSAGHSTLWRVNLLMPELPEFVCDIPQAAQSNSTEMSVCNGQLYYQSARMIWKVSPAGEFTSFTATSRVQEASAITPQGVITYDKKDIYAIYNDHFRVYTPKGEDMDYLQFLARPYLLLGVSELVPAEGTECFGEVEVIDDIIDTGITHSFRTERGDYVAEITVVNKSDKEFKLTKISIYLSESELRLRPNRVADPVPAGETAVYSFVFPAEALGDAVSQEELDAAYFHIWAVQS